MKYNLHRQGEEGEEEGDSDNEIQQLKQKIRLRRQQIRRSRLPPSASSNHSEPSIEQIHFNATIIVLTLFFLFSVFHSTDSGTSRHSSQDSYQGLSDSGSAEEVEECELRGRNKTDIEPFFYLSISQIRCDSIHCVHLYE